MNTNSTIRYGVTKFSGTSLDFLRTYARELVVDGKTYYILPILRRAIEEDNPLDGGKESAFFIDCFLSQLPEEVVNEYMKMEAKRYEEMMAL